MSVNVTGRAVRDAAAGGLRAGGLGAVWFGDGERVPVDPLG